MLPKQKGEKRNSGNAETDKWRGKCITSKKGGKGKKGKKPKKKPDYVRVTHELLKGPNTPRTDIRIHLGG